MNATSETLKIGIFGGTFDPFHSGHLHAANTIHRELSLDQLSIVPSYIPVHRDMPQASSAQRLEMIELSIGELSHVLVDSREIERQGASYSLHTVKEYRVLYPDAKLFFILGSDAMSQFNRWYHWQEILDFVNLIVLKRPGHELQLNSELSDFFSARLTNDVVEIKNSTCGRLYVSTKSMLLYSATEVRDVLSSGSDVSAMLSEKVLSYIQDHQLYGKF